MGVPLPAAAALHRQAAAAEVTAESTAAVPACYSLKSTLLHSRSCSTAASQQTAGHCVSHNTTYQEQHLTFAPSLKASRSEVTQRALLLENMPWAHTAKGDAASQWPPVCHPTMHPTHCRKVQGQQCIARCCDRAVWRVHKRVHK
jgi:hypothetical protein